MQRSPPALNIDDLPGHNIRRLHQISVGIFLQELTEHGLTPVQYAVLQTAANHPGIDQRTLARRIALDASTTGGVVDRMETRGWLTRNTAPEDRRSRQVVLTEAGVALLDDAVPCMQRAQEQILAPLSETQRGEFMKLLCLLVHTNNAHSRAPSEAIK